MPITPILKILIADDHNLFLEGIEVLIKTNKSFHVIGKAYNGEHLVELTKSTKPDIILADIVMPKLTGIEATKIIKKQFPEIGIIALTFSDNEDLILQMLEAGAYGYLLKTTDKEELSRAIIAVHKGEKHYSKEVDLKLHELIKKTRFNPFKKKENIALSPNEIRMIEFICLQLSAKEIADKMNLSFRTVQDNKTRIQQKLGAQNSVGIAIYAIKHNLIDIKQVEKYL
jgi:DNA-binding NarL/FixJ family response regulator